MALLGFAAGGRLGNFGGVGVDQSTFAPAVFLWFVGIGALTMTMSGGIARRPKRAKPVAGPETEPEPETEPQPEPVSPKPRAEIEAGDEPRTKSRRRPTPVRQRRRTTRRTRRTISLLTTTPRPVRPVTVRGKPRIRHPLLSRRAATAPRAPECTGAAGGSGLRDRFAARFSARGSRGELPGAGGSGRRRPRLRGPSRLPPRRRCRLTPCGWVTIPTALHGMRR